MLRFDPQANCVPEVEISPDPVESKDHSLMVAAFALLATVGGAIGIWFLLSSGAGSVDALADYVPPTFGITDESAPVSMAGIGPTTTLSPWSDQADGPHPGRFRRINTKAYRRGLSALDAGDHSGAVEHLREAVRVNPEHADAHYKLGLAYMRVRNRDGALREKAVLEMLDPNLANLLGNLVQ